MARGKIKKVRFIVSLFLAIFLSANAAWAANDCTGATYYDANTDTCISCPTGYDYNTDAGKTDITQCQIHCDAGTYLISGYTKLEYIQTNGGQYIETGIQSTGIGLKTDIQLELTQKKGEQAMIGRSSSGGYEVYFSSDGNTIGTWRSSSENAKLSINYAVNTLYRVQSEMTTNSITQDVNGTQVSTSKPLNTGTNANIYLFRHTSNYYLHAKIYYAKIWKDGVLVRDFIPVRRDSDGEVGLYDIVSGTFFTNSGTGTFTEGQEIGGFCNAAGIGYWSSAQTINYGSSGTRTACTNKPEHSQYSDSGTSANCPWICDETFTENNGACVCIGARYINSDTDTCDTCPVGYDYNTTPNKTSINQCQKHCDAGTWCGEYTELEYITIDNGAYIDTELKMGIDITVGRGRLYVDASLLNITNSSGEKVIAGGSNFWVGKDNNWCIGYGANASDVCTSVAPSSNRCIYDLDLVRNKYTVYDTENENYLLNISVTPGSSVNNSHKISIGGYNGTTSASNVRIYLVSIYNSGIPIFRGIPMRRNSDNTVGLYDFISGTFKTKSNASGTITAGPDTSYNFCSSCTDVGSGYYAPAQTVNYGSNGIRNACPSEYPLSDTGAGTQTDCYASCTPTQVPHATAFAGATYYGGTSTCIPADSNSCDTGYSYVATNGNVLAHCNANQVAISWYNNDTLLSVENEATSCVYGEPLVVPDPPSARAGYVFDGWRLK